MTGGFGVSDRLQGWDIAYSTTFDAINKAIIDDDVSPKTMSYKDKHNNTLDGTFGAWQIVENDDAVGKVIPMNIPFHVTKFVYHGASGAKTFKDLDYTFQFNVTLEFVLHKTLGSGAEVKHLKTCAPDKSTGVNETVALQYDGTDIIEATIGAMLEKWLKANVQNFGHVFSEATMGLADKNPVFADLLPQAIGYAVAHGATVTPVAHNGKAPVHTKRPAVFSVLAMVTKTLPSGVVAATDASLVPDGCEAGIALSSSTFLSKMLAPRMIEALQLPKPSTFEVTKGFHPTFTNMSDMVLPDFDLSDIDGFSAGDSGTSPTMKPGAFSAMIDGQQLRFMFSDLTFNDNTGMNRFRINYTTWMTASLTSEGHLSVTEEDNAKADASIVLTDAGQNYQIWTTFAISTAIQIVVVVLALIPGAQPAAAAVDASAEIAEVAAEEMVSDISIIDSNEVSAAETEAETELTGIGAKALQAIKNFGPKIAKKIGLGLLVTFGTRAISDLPTELAFIRSKTANPTPTMHDLANTMLTANLWNGKSMGNMVCTKATFDDGMTLGLKRDTAAKGGN